jgi:hypothetical protein
MNLRERLFGKPYVNEVELNFENSLIQLDSFDKFVHSQPCPSCKKPELYIVSHERGAKGWESSVRCNGCGTKGTVNQTGFHFELGRGAPKQ